MKYPPRLIPNSKQIIIDRINPKHHLCRWVDPSVELIDEEGKLSTEAIDTERIFDLSMNKIPYSEEEDIYIIVKDDYYNKEWKEGVHGELVPSDKFEIDKNRNCFFLKVGDIEGKEEFFPFPHDKKSYDYKFVIKIIHNPLIANYYHCILKFDLFTPEGDEHQIGRKSKSKKIIQFQTRLILINNAKFEI